MEIKNLITFKKIIETGSFTKAAEELGYAQSSVSAHIKLIESYYGKELFERIGKEIKVTSFAQELLKYVNEFIADYEKIQNIGQENENIMGHLRIGAPESLMMYRLYHVIYKYKQRYPDVGITVESNLCSKLRSDTVKGYYDLSFILQPLIFVGEFNI